VDVFLTGGTGFVGRTVCRELVSAGHKVRLLVRPGSRSGNRAGASPGVQVHVADPAVERQLRDALRGCDAVIHLIGIIREIGSQTFENVHTRLTRQFLTAASAENVPRWVHMSALGTRPGAASHYHQTKWAAEESVRASAIAWTIFRPSMIYGSEDEFTNLFARISAWSPALPLPGPGTNLIQPIAVERVGEAFAAALDQPEAVGKTMDLCGPERLTFNDAVREILAVLDRRRMLIHIPEPIARGQAAIIERVFPLLLRRAPPFNRDQLLMLREDNIGDGAPANALFGLQHSTFREGLQAYLGSGQLKH
jgi:NADH dehydrogenase